MPSNSAEYMRSYRARRKAAAQEGAVLDADANRAMADAPFVRIAELEAEVRHLKAELAKRPASAGTDESFVETLRAERATGAVPGFNTQPFRPVPKVRK